MRGATLIGVLLLVVGLAILLVFSPDTMLGQEKGKGGKPDKPPDKGKPKPGLYRVYMSITPGAMGFDTASSPNCNPYGYVLAEWDERYNYLRANGTMIDLNIRIPLLMQLLTDVGWTRKYDAGKGFSGVFNVCPEGPINQCYDCYGQTDGEHGYHGALFIKFGKKKRQSTIHFIWHFDYYTAPDVREHFSLVSEDIPFQAWTGDDIISKPVTGWFDLQYYLNDPDQRANYKSLTDDIGLTFDFYITIEKINQ